MRASKDGFVPLRREQQSALAFCLTGLILAAPSFLLPFVTLNKFGNTHVCFLMNTAGGLWHNGMAVLGGWVLFCGMLAPLVLLFILAATFANGLGASVKANKGLVRVATMLAHWAMPDVLALGVLVSVFKVRDLVNVRLGPGFWCYLATALMLLLALRSFKVEFDDANETSPKGKEFT
jgi:paraquat-inducible protein A